MVSMPKIDRAAVAAALADRDQLVAFAAMVLCCDPAVTAARMGYDTHGRGISYITATGAAKATGMPIATATRALLGLESAGLARCKSEGNAWRPDITALDTLAPPTSADAGSLADRRSTPGAPISGPPPAAAEIHGRGRITGLSAG